MKKIQVTAARYWRATLFLLPILLCSGGCGYHEMGNSLHLEAKSSAFPPLPDVLVYDQANGSVNIWKAGNFWGWNTFQVEVAKGATNEIFVIKRKPSAWSRSFPQPLAISPGDSVEVHFDFSDGWWEIPEGIDLSNRPLRLRVRSKIPPSPEAKKYDVLVGECYSDWQQLR